MTTAQQRKQKERQARRQRIQDAARVVFAERGYAKTSIERVARQAGLSVGAIYLYFRSKEDLYTSLLEETFTTIHSSLERLSGSDGSPRDRLRAAWTLLCDWAGRDVEGNRRLRLLSQSNLKKQLSDEVAEAMRGGIQGIQQRLATVIEQGVRSGHYHADPHSGAQLLWAVLWGLLESQDARGNLDLSGAEFSDSARYAFAAIEAGMSKDAGKLAA